MTSTRAFRLSLYLPLGLAAAALGYAEASIFPEVGVFAGIVILALLVIYRMESNFRQLTLGEFNRLGLCIAVAAVLWAGFRVVREAKTGEFATLGWTAFIVALVAPVLLAAVCALLLRQEKKPGDYWFIQAAGLSAVVLAGAMAEQSLLVVLTAIYALSVVWFLTQFHRARSGAARERFAFSKPAMWLGLAAALAVPLYLLTPRSPFDKLEFGSSRIEIGFAADQMVDLNQTGELRQNPETAFEVIVKDSAGKAKEDLPGESLWRGPTLFTYGNGAWRRDAQAQFQTFPSAVMMPGPWTPPNFGPTGFQVSFAVPSKLKSLFLLDPVQWEPGAGSPIAERLPDGTMLPWRPLGNGRIFGRDPNRRVPDEREAQYVQHTRPPIEKDLSPAYNPPTEINRVLVAYTVPRVKEYTDKVVSDLVAAGKLPSGARSRDAIRLNPPEEYHEAIARALRDHLSERPDLSYTTNLKRVNREVDPVEDFLLHSKAGHCERFATALVLMLRSQGIPAVMVLGFKGCEHLGEGKYAVKQEFAHAWAEALIARRDTEIRRMRWHWLTLDPSPAAERSSGGESSTSSSAWAALERLLFRYTPEERERTLKALAAAFTSREFLVGAPVALASLVGLWLAFKRTRGRGRSSDSVAWFETLAAAMAPWGIVPEPGETAREFAGRCAARLPDTDADVPIRWVELHYGERFGGAVPDEPRARNLATRLEAIRRRQESGT